MWYFPIIHNYIVRYNMHAEQKYSFSIIVGYYT